MPRPKLLRLIGLAALMLNLIPRSLHAQSTTPARQTGTVAFESFRYTGTDPFAADVTPGTFLNPILAGFYPDPSICRAGDDYYLVNSSFCYYPGIPVFHSRDLVSWQQIGNALTRPSQSEPLDGTSTTGGAYAPAITHHAGKFYIACTLAGRDGGNFVITADDPAGPWSDPIWFRDINGIDPSPFFDDDGRAYIVHNGPPPDDKPLYPGHRALWLQQVDLDHGTLIGPRRLLVNGGTDLARQPVWIEGPHLLKKDGWYVLIAAEDGTGTAHSEVAFRSRSVTGPFDPFPGNPILTQRDLPPDRPDPVTCTGHADLVQLPTGDWYAVFLGCRPADRDGHVLMGRETFMLPVRWQDGWPIILDRGATLPRVVNRPSTATDRSTTPPTTGTFTFTDDFDSPALDPGWMTFRRPQTHWWDVTDGALHVRPLPAALTSPTESPSFLCRRQQHADYEIQTTVDVGHETVPCDAGLAIFQDERHHFIFGARSRDGVARELFVERAFAAGTNSRDGVRSEVLQTAALASGARHIELRVTGKGTRLDFTYRIRPETPWLAVLKGADARILSEKVAGGFTGVCVGLYARMTP